MHDRQQPPSAEENPIDPRTPHAARVYSYLLGGKDNFAPDRMVAEHITDLYPKIRAAARENRRFHERAGAWMARQGIRQFIDMGCGLPTADNTHQIVGREAPGARVLYADHDAQVVVHARALLTGRPGVEAVRGDVRDPEPILASWEARNVLRPDEPTGLFLTAVLHFVEDGDDPAGLVARFMAALAPGSCVAISHGTLDNLPADIAETALKIYDLVREPAVMRTRPQVRALFGQLDLQPPCQGATPAVVTADRWIGPDVTYRFGLTPPANEGEALWCGAAKKPC